MNDAKPGRGRWTLVALAILFLAPVVIAAVIYSFDLWRPAQGVNHGDLIQPVIVLPRTQQPTADGSMTDSGYLYGRWTLTHFADGGCSEACRAALVTTRQLRLAMGHRIDRIDRVLFLHNVSEPGLLDEQPDLLHVIPTGDAGKQIIDALVANGGANRIFLVDPLGNLVLSYPLDVDPANIRDDLKKLLRLSTIG